MEHQTVFVAGEPLAELEHALDHLRIVELPCRCLGFDGTLPRLLSQSLERALKTIDAEIAERTDDEDLDDEAMDSVRELLLRLGRVQTVDD